MTLAPTLSDLAADPSLIDQLPGGPLVAALSAQASAIAYRLAMRAACAPMIVDAPRSEEAKGVGIKKASDILGVSPSTIRRKIRVECDPAYYGLLVRTGTTRLVFSVPACRRFVARPLGPVA